MTVTVRVKVLRPMVGDDGKGGNKRFAPGDYRTIDPADADRLAATGAVEVVRGPSREKPRQAKKARGAKKAAAPRNKKAAAPKNKSA